MTTDDHIVPGTGAGAKSLGEELANSDAFAECQVREGLQGGVLPRAGSDSEVTSSQGHHGSFKTSGYNLRQVFADTAAAAWASEGKAHEHGRRR